MQFRIFTIPIADSGAAQDEMNQFLRNQKILHVERQFFAPPSGAFWCFCVQYLTPVPSVKQVQSNRKVDYRHILDEEAFGRFAKLRAIRKELAEQDFIPAYAIFTDLELAEMAKAERFEASCIKNIDGIGEKRFQKYGQAMLEKFYKASNKGETQ